MHSPLTVLYICYGVCPGIFCFAYPMPTIRYPMGSKYGSTPSRRIHCIHVTSDQVCTHFAALQTEMGSPAACFCVGQCRQEAVHAPPSTVQRLGLHQLPPVSAVVFVSQHDSVRHAGCQDDTAIWPLIKEQVPLQLYAIFAEQHRHPFNMLSICLCC